MEHSKPRFRILNKTAKDVTIKIGPEKHTIPWDEYNKTFVTVDKFWAEFNEENQKNHDKAEDAIADAIMYLIMAQASEGKDVTKHMTYMLAFGTKIEEIQKLLNCSLLEATMIIKKRMMPINPFMANPMFPVSKSQKKLRRKMEREAEEEVKNTAPVQEETGKPTLGDAFSILGDLKTKLEEENK